MRKQAPVQKTLGEVLKKARENAGLSQRDVGRLTGMSESQISQLEMGKRPDPAFSTVVRLAKALKISLDALADLAPGSSIKSTLRAEDLRYLRLLHEIEAAKNATEKVTVRLAALLAETAPKERPKRTKLK